MRLACLERQDVSKQARRRWTAGNGRVPGGAGVYLHASPDTSSSRYPKGTAVDEDEGRESGTGDHWSRANNSDVLLPDALADDADEPRMEWSGLDAVRDRLLVRGIFWPGRRIVDNAMEGAGKSLVTCGCRTPKTAARSRRLPRAREPSEGQWLRYERRQRNGLDKRARDGGRIVENSVEFGNEGKIHRCGSRGGRRRRGLLEDSTGKTYMSIPVPRLCRYGHAGCSALSLTTARAAFQRRSRMMWIGKRGVDERSATWNRVRMRRGRRTECFALVSTVIRRQTASGQSPSLLGDIRLLVGFGSHERRLTVRNRAFYLLSPASESPNILHNLHPALEEDASCRALVLELEIDRVHLRRYTSNIALIFASHCCGH
ncbi:hypothetical protein C8F01DRAFT_1230486 [Mycena amicta]|nr:hypothetical protein C8F01DRAFT_1230486 [Mycena amicta]